jgi:hypothetical protein
LISLSFRFWTLSLEAKLELMSQRTTLVFWVSQITTLKVKRGGRKEQKHGLETFETCMLQWWPSSNATKQLPPRRLRSPLDLTLTRSCLAFDVASTRWTSRNLPLALISTGPPLWWSSLPPTSSCLSSPSVSIHSRYSTPLQFVFIIAPPSPCDLIPPTSAIPLGRAVIFFLGTSPDRHEPSTMANSLWRSSTLTLSRFCIPLSP